MRTLAKPPMRPSVVHVARDGKADDFAKVLAVTGKASSTLKRLSEALTDSRVGNWRRVLGDNEIDEMHRVVAERGLGELIANIEAQTPATPPGEREPHRPAGRTPIQRVMPVRGDEKERF